MSLNQRFRIFVRNDHDLDRQGRAFMDRVKGSFDDPYCVDARRAVEYYDDLETRLIEEYLREGTIDGYDCRARGAGAWSVAYKQILTLMEEYRQAAEEEAEAA